MEISDDGEMIESESLDIESPLLDDDNTDDIGLSILPLRDAMSRYVSRIMAAPSLARRQGLLPSHAAFNVVKLARQGNKSAQHQIKTVLSLAESDFPGAEKAQDARENFFRAAALQDEEFDEEEAYNDSDDSESIGASLDDEIEQLEISGEQVGLGFLPLLGGLGAAVLAYLLIKPSAALAKGKDEPAKIPISPEASKAPTKPSDYIGKKVGEVPAAILDQMKLDLARIHNRINPATLADTPWNQLNSLHLVMPIPSKGRDPKGQIFVRRPAKERLAQNAAIQASFGNADDMIVPAPVVIQPSYGPLGFKIPDWAVRIVTAASNIVAPGSGTAASQILPK